ncbi:MAG: hypothetical protein IOC59_00450 [Methylobacterium sp.]|nr:hypothetical protein [Methylobacterium sp.]MCA3602609.1 hypothetical protein [Methylobacterium sp.]MCA3613673.1 hypothetical protein [Methylobacterium sp.]
MALAQSKRGKGEGAPSLLRREAALCDNFGIGFLRDCQSRPGALQSPPGHMHHAAFWRVLHGPQRLSMYRRISLSRMKVRRPFFTMASLPALTSSYALVDFIPAMLMASENGTRRSICFIRLGSSVAER